MIESDWGVRRRDIKLDGVWDRFFGECVIRVDIDYVEELIYEDFGESGRVGIKV